MGIDELVDFFHNEKGWGTNPSFYLAKVDDFSDNYDIANTSSLQGRDFSSIDINNLKKGYLHDRDIAISSVYPLSRTNFCGANCSGFFVVAPDGYLYKCWNTVDKLEENIGNVKDKINFSTEHTKWLLLEPKGKCPECKFMPICLGGCPYKYFLNGETECVHIVFSLNEKLKLAYKDYKLNKEKIAKTV